MFRFELLKYRKNLRLLVLIVLLLLGFYLTTAFRGRMDPMELISLSAFWDHPDYRERVKAVPEAEINDAWAENVLRPYRTLVDAHCMTVEESRQQLKQFEWITYSAEEALGDRYNIEYALGVLPYEVFQAHEGELEDISSRLGQLYPMARDPVGYVKWDEARLSREGVPHYRNQGYTDAQHRDYLKVLERHCSNLTVVDGYCLGWDVLTSAMQYLPYTLGIALLLILGPLFSQERRYAMEPILRTCRRGRNSLLRTKLALALLLAVGLWILFQGFMLVSVALSYGLQGARVTVLHFGVHPNLYGLCWGDYYGIQSMFSFLGTLTFALMICVMSSLLPLRIMLPVGLVLVVLTGVPIQTFNYAECAFSPLQKLQVLTPPQLMAAYPTLQIYQSYSLGEFQLRLPPAMLMATAVESIVLLAVLYRRAGARR